MINASAFFCMIIAYRNSIIMLDLPVKMTSITLFFALLSACSTAVKEEVLVPPKALNQAVSSVMIKPFSGAYGKLLSTQLQGKLKSEGHIDVRNLGSEAILNGEIIVSNVNEERYSKKREVTKKRENGTKYKTIKTTYYVSWRASASVSYSLLQNGVVLAAHRHDTNVSVTEQGESTAQAKAYLPTKEAMALSMLTNLTDKIVHDISPHKEIWSFNLQGGNDLLSAGIEYYKKKLYSQAEGYWERALNTSDAPEDIAAAAYNLGVLRMREGRLSDAFSLFQKADSLQPVNSTYMEALRQVEQAGQGKEVLKNRGFSSLSNRLHCLDCLSQESKIQPMAV